MRHTFHDMNLKRPRESNFPHKYNFEESPREQAIRHVDTAWGTI